MSRAENNLPKSYPALLEDIKARIRRAQIKAALSVNRELIKLYWDIGSSIVRRQRKEGWGKSIVEMLSRDIKKEFSDIAGFSAQNLWHMRAFYRAWTEEVSNLQQPVGDLDRFAAPSRRGTDGSCKENEKYELCPCASVCACRVVALCEAWSVAN